MGCVLCTWLNDRLCSGRDGRRTFWEQSGEWERDAANDWDLWDDEDEAVRERVRQASKVYETDPARALELRRELAEGGSSLAMRQAAWQYENGDGTPRDLALAEHYYEQALLAGSWLATLSLAGLLYRNHIDERWEGILENGVESDFVPAAFWLATYRYKRRPGRRSARQLRPLMEWAAEAGHPGARVVLAKWKILGKFGLGAMREGVRELRAVVRDYPCDGVEAEAEVTE